MQLVTLPWWINFCYVNDAGDVISIAVTVNKSRVPD